MPTPHDQERVEITVEKAECVEERLSILSSKRSTSRAQYRENPESRDVVYDALQNLTRYHDFLYEVRGYLDEAGAL